MLTRWCLADIMFTNLQLSFQMRLCLLWSQKDQPAWFITKLLFWQKQVTWRVHYPPNLAKQDVSQQVLGDFSLCKHFSLQFEKSVDMTYTAQLMVIVWMAFVDSFMKEDFFTLFAIKGEDKRWRQTQQVQIVHAWKHTLWFYCFVPQRPSSQSFIVIS